MSERGKTEKATPKKREDERKKGNIFLSRDVNNALSFVVILFAFKLLMHYAAAFLQSQILNGISRLKGIDALTPRLAANLITDTVLASLLLVTPIGLGVAVLGITLTGIQTKFLFTGKKLRPQLSRLNPANGIKRAFSLRSLMELLKSVIKVSIIGFVIYGKVRTSAKAALNLPYAETKTMLSWIGEAIYDVAISISIYLALFAAVDFIYQKWEYEKDIAMTKQEIKDEYKQTEGDPQVKGRIKDIQRKLAAMRMMKKVAYADVVIRNPTHYAVALKYDPPGDKAPVVLAKGQDYTALKIIETAKKHHIHITENKPLARGLYEAVSLDQPIPEEFYKPVADILAFIYKLKHAAGEDSETRKEKA